MRVFIFLLIFIYAVQNANAQQSKIDSLQKLLIAEKIDTNRVIQLWNLAQLYQAYQPDTALILAEKAYNLSRKIKYVEGESRSLNQIANAFNRVGNYAKALEYYIKKLKIEEVRKNQENLAIAYMNIATVYLFQEEYRKAIDHTLLADSIIVAYKIDRLRKYSLLNLGDMYEKYNKLDSAMELANMAYTVAHAEGDENMTGSALNNLANICLKRGYLDLALKNYRKAIPLLIKTRDEDVLCESSLGLAKTFKQLNQMDSAIAYARFAFILSKNDGFLSRNLEASRFLHDHFKSMNMLDSAYKYQHEMLLVKDSISSNQRVKQGQIIALNEQERQQEIRERKLKDELDLRLRIQYIGIGVLIPILFLLSFYLRNKKVKPRFIEYLGLVSLLMFFEYITLILHPVVVRLTNHVPLFELVVFSVIATILTRTHHRLEGWFLKHLSFKQFRKSNKADGSSDSTPIS